MYLHQINFPLKQFPLSVGKYQIIILLWAIYQTFLVPTMIKGSRFLKNLVVKHEGVIGSNSVAICIKVTTVLPNFQTGLGTTSGLGIYSDFTSRYPVEIPLFGDMFMYMLSKICRPLCK